MLAPMKLPKVMQFGAFNGTLRSRVGARILCSGLNSVLETAGIGRTAGSDFRVNPLPSIACFSFTVRKATHLEQRQATATPLIAYIFGSQNTGPIKV